MKTSLNASIQNQNHTNTNEEEKKTKRRGINNCLVAHTLAVVNSYVNIIFFFDTMDWSWLDQKSGIIHKNKLKE